MFEDATKSYSFCLSTCGTTVMTYIDNNLRVTGDYGLSVPSEINDVIHEL